MAHFRATVAGARGKVVSRLGSAQSGITAEVQSWQGKVVVSAYTKGETDCVRIECKPHSNGAGVTRLLYEGPIAPSETF